MDSRLLVVIGIVLLVLLSALFFQSYSIYTVRGESMKPTFSECTIVVADKRVSPFELQTGEIVVVDISSQNAQYTEIAHRVVENSVIAKQFSTRGDNASLYDFPDSIDGFFGYDKYLGKVVRWTNCPPFWRNSNAS